MNEQQLIQKKKLSLPNLISLVLLFLVLIAVPAIVIVFGMKTRTQIKADVECSQPRIPDPSECVGGEWKISKNTDGCIRFICILR